MIKKFFKSLRGKLFGTLCIVIIMIIAFFIIISNAVLETLYYFSKTESLLGTYSYINENLKDEISDKFKLELEKISVNNTFEILIKNNEDVIYETNKDFLNEFGTLDEIKYDVKYSIFNNSDLMYSKSGNSIRRVIDKKTGITYILMVSKLENNNDLYIRIPITPIQNSADMSNRFIFVLGFAAIILGGISIIFITEKFSKPIEELNDIANEMSNLNFKRKYRINDSEDELNELGKSINTLSDKLEDTIHKLKLSNAELEKDIEEKSKIDEMRKQFISDVSHELKTPIALIQGYAEGLADGVITSKEDVKFYIDVILDEANKMDKLVKRLLELMKLEYGDREFNDGKFDITELISDVIKNSKVVLEDNNIEMDFDDKEKVYCYADDFYIEQVVMNYFTNAIKNVEEVDGKKKIKIRVRKGKEEGKVRITVFNTGKKIDEENLNRIWTRFFKADESRDRSKGGTGIGLALVKAIMTRYKSKYGVTNKKDGVEFYFEIQEAK